MVNPQGCETGDGYMKPRVLRGEVFNTESSKASTGNTKNGRI